MTPMPGMASRCLRAGLTACACVLAITPFLGCGSIPGTFLGDEPAIEGCLFEDGGCSNLTPEQCTNMDGVPQGSAVYCDDAEPNDTFNQKTNASFDADGLLRWEGAVFPRDDLDVLSFGPLSAGDRLVINANTSGSPLDVSIALFDAEQRLVYNNDDRGGISSPLDSRIDWIVRHGGDTYHLAIASSAFADYGAGTGPYTVDVLLSSGHDVPEPTSQTLLLNFDGGPVDSPSLGRQTISPFNAGEISPLYHGQTGRLKELVRQAVEQNYERFDVVVITSDDPPPLDDEDVSTIHMGGFSATLFGVAEAVDLYNADYCDDAIIYTESFTPAVFMDAPSLEGLAVAIGNVAAHEAGHLLGLNHVNDDMALMDDASPADAFLNNQEFTIAPLSQDLMPLGMQDAVMLLSETVGMR